MANGDGNGKHNLFTTANLVTVILTLSSALLWVAWLSVDKRLDGLESGRTTPMSNASKITFDHFYSEHVRIDKRLEDVEARLRQAEARIVQLEYEDRPMRNRQQ